MNQRSMEIYGCGKLPNTEAQRYLESRMSIQDAIKRYANRFPSQAISIGFNHEINVGDDELMEGTNDSPLYVIPSEPERDYRFYPLPTQMDVIDAINSSLIHLRYRGGGKSFNSIEKIIQRKFQCKDCELYHKCKSSLRSEFSNIICPCFLINEKIITEIHLADQKIEETKIDTHPRHTIQTTCNKFGEIINKLEIIL